MVYKLLLNKIFFKQLTSISYELIKIFKKWYKNIFRVLLKSSLKLVKNNKNNNNNIIQKKG